MSESSQHPQIGKAKRPEAIAPDLFAGLRLILALNEALLEHLLVTEPQIRDVG
jgi:hypothetical protein